MFWVTRFHVNWKVLILDIIKYRNHLSLNIAKHRNISFNVFIEYYSGDLREIQKGSKLGFSEQIFLIS